MSESQPKLPHMEIAAAILVAAMLFIGVRSLALGAPASVSPWPFVSLSALLITLLVSPQRVRGQMWVVSGMAVLSAILFVIANLLE